MTRHVFVPGLTATQRAELAVLSQSDDVEFHDLLDVDRLLDSEDLDLEVFLDDARRELEAFSGTVDGFIAHWDFPTSVIVPILAAERGLPAPSLEAVLRCEHKYWSRLEQRASVPEVTPGFAVFDPDDPQAIDALDDLAFPVFVKPVKSFSSQLSARVDDEEEFERVRARMAENGNRLGGALEQALARVEVPPELADLPGTAVMAEEVITGRQFAPEGCVHDGEVTVYGTFDMEMHPRSHRLQRLILPSSAPPEILDHMLDVCERYLHHIGFDHGCFNAEFLWDADRDRLRIVEVNTRISQSHSDLFTKVDGMSNHAAAFDVATGCPPRAAQGQGRFATAEQLHVSTEREGEVLAVPDRAVLLDLRERFPDTVVELEVRPGDRLGDGVFEHNGVHDLAVVYHGARDREELDRQHQQIVERIRQATVIVAPDQDPDDADDAVDATAGEDDADVGERAS